MKEETKDTILTVCAVVVILLFCVLLLTLLFSGFDKIQQSLKQQNKEFVYKWERRANDQSSQSI